MTDFDLSDLDVATGSDEGRPMEVWDIRTNAPAKDKAGNSITITLRGKHSKVAREVVQRSAERRIERLRNKRPYTADDARRDMVDLLAACTVDWTFKVLDGKEFPCTKKNAEKLWSDDRFILVRQQAEAFIDEDANFMKASSTS